MIPLDDYVEGSSAVVDGLTNLSHRFQGERLIPPVTVRPDIRVEVGLNLFMAR